MRILVIDNHSHHSDNFITLLSDHEVHFSDYTATDFTNVQADVVVLSGSHESPFYSQKFENELQFIQSTDLPLIGICLGCQLIADAYDCGFYREESKVEWVMPIKYLPNQAHYEVYEWHKFCINELWVNLTGVAASEYGYEIIKHNHKKQWWLQFHPEVNEPANHGALLFTTILSEIIW